MKCKIFTQTVLQILIVTMLSAVAGLSAAEEKITGVKEIQLSHKPIIMYKPPMRGAPKARVGGGTRGPGGQEVVLQVLAPDHAGLTTMTQPTLYWYASSPVAVRLDFSLISDDDIEPLLEIETGKERVAGIQKLKLSDHNISLQSDVAYQWSVAIVTDEKSRSSDVVASGVIKLVNPSASLVEQISSNHGKDLVAVYANEGIWYDALDTISNLIDKSQQEEDLLAIRASMLDQVGLPDILTR